MAVHEQLERLHLLRASLRSAAFPTMGQFDAAVAAVAAGVEAGAIRNTVLADAKHTLGSAVEAAWDDHVRKPHFYGKYDTLPSSVRDLYYSITIMGLHGIIAASKKLAKSGAKAPAVDAMHDIVGEALPLALAVASLKDKVVKGRAPRIFPAKPINPSKVVKTCPVCFRPIAVVRGTMAHHGYKRPGWGRQTGSCHGIRFKPLEVSSEGLEWLIAWLRELLTAKLAAHASRGSKQKLLAKHPRKVNEELEWITRSDPQWPRVYAAFVAELEAEIDALKREIPPLEERLAEWNPEEQS